MPKFRISMTETFRWTDDVEAADLFAAANIAENRWLNGEYTDGDSGSGVGDFEIDYDYCGEIKLYSESVFAEAENAE